MKKRAVIMPETLVIIVALLIAAVVLLFATGGFKEVIEAVAGKQTCQWSFFLHSMTKGPFGGSGIPPECRMKKRTLTLNEIERGTKEAKERITFFKKNEEEYGEYAGHFIEEKKKHPNFQDTTILYEYSMDKIIANEMKSCTDKVLNYKFPLFDEWWKLWKWDEEPKNAIQALEFWKLDYNHPPIFCVVCARIKFDKPIEDKFNQPITSMKDYMQSNPVPLDQKNRNYLDYITDPKSSQYFSQDYTYTVSEPLAVVYARINIWKGTNWILKTIDYLPLIDISEESTTPTNLMLLIPFKDISTTCNYAIS